MATPTKTPFKNLRCLSQHGRSLLRQTLQQPEFADLSTRTISSLFPISKSSVSNYRRGIIPKDSSETKTGPKKNVMKLAINY